MQKCPNSKLIATPNTPLNQTTGAAVNPANLSCIPLNRKTEGQNMQCFAFDFQNTLQHNSSADKVKQNKLQMHSEKMSKRFKLNLILKKEEIQ